MKKKESSGKKAFFGIFILLFSVVSIYLFSKNAEKRTDLQEINSPVSVSKKEVVSKVFSSEEERKTEPVDNSPNLSQVVNQSLEGTHGRYGIVIKNLKTGEKFELNNHQVFTPASMYKLWVMGEVFNQMEKGKINGDDELSGSVDDLNREFKISDEDAELTDGDFDFTITQALEQMITISHNYASLLLTKRVGLSALGQFLKRNGFNESRIGTNGDFPVTTPSDMALFFEKLQSGKLGNAETTRGMVELLKRQKLNDVLPKYLPEGTEFAHKTGNIDAFDNDGGIVYSTSGDYIIVIMSETDSPSLAEERMANVSKAVWDYFEN